MPFGIGMPELLVIGAIVCLLFGGRKFAEMGRGLGEGIKGFKKALSSKGDPEDKETKE